MDFEADVDVVWTVKSRGWSHRNSFGRSHLTGSSVMDESLSIPVALQPPEPITVVIARGATEPRAFQIIRTREARRTRAESARAAVARMPAIRNGPDEDDGEFLRELDEADPGRFALKRFYTDGSDPA